MSIGIGLICTDGIVVCADREFSHPGFSSFSQKIQSICYGRGVVNESFQEVMTAPLGTFGRYVVLAQAGVDPDMRNVSKDLTDRIKGHDLTNEEVEEEFRECVESQVSAEPEGHYQAILPMPNREMSQAQDNRVFHSGNDAVIGCGDHSLARYLLEMLLPPVGRLETIDTCQAAIIVSYIVQSIKKYVQGCGGETDIFYLPESGAGVHQGNGILEEEFKALEYRMGMWFRTMANKDTDVVWRDRETEGLIGYLREMRTKLETQASTWPPIRFHYGSKPIDSESDQT